MRRAPLKAAVSALVLCAAGCAGTEGSAPQKGAAAPPQKAGASVPGAAPIAAKTAELPPPTSIEEQLQKAQGLRAQGRLGEATHILAQMVLAAPDDPRVVGEYGKTLVQQGRSDDAVAFLKRATELRPADWTLYSALGVAYDQMDDRKHAKIAYERALALHPGDMAVLNNYAVSRMLAGDLETAQRLLLQAQAADSTNAKVQGNLQRLAQMKASRSAATQAKSATAVVAGAPKSISPLGASSANAAPQPEKASSSLAAAKTAAHKPAASKSVQKTPPPNSTTANKTASATKTAAAKVPAKKPAPPPALRTADQNE